MDQMSMDLTGRKTYTVSELTSAIKRLLERRMGSLWVEGEVSNHGRPASGHHYFTLKDEGSQVRCVMFRQKALYSRFLPTDGAKVLVHARIGVYEPRGEYQLIVDRVEPMGVGALEMAFRELKERLAKEGLFDDDRKKTVPEFPRKVGVVTSGTGAAIRDIIRTVTSRSKLVDLQIVPVRVQGEEAAGEIVDAIKMLDSDGNPWGRLDAIIIGRGGGSLEDLWAFNEEIVARAIAACRTPLISAVGHETDFTISDFTADHRAATPTAAAQLVAPRQAEIIHKLDVLKSRMSAAMINTVQYREEKLIGLRRALPDPRRNIEEGSIHLDELAARMKRHLVSEMNLSSERLTGIGLRLKSAPLIERIDRKRATADELFRRLGSAAGHRIDISDGVLKAIGGRLSALNPLAVLERGYSVTRKSDGTIVKNVDQIEIGDSVEITLAKGKIGANINNKEP